MRIDELDELQGVTPQLVTDWLLANGWTQTKPRWWERGEDGFLFDSETFDSLWFWTYALAAIYTGGNVQALLREINPRMRKGMPSQAALAAHDHWLVRDTETGEISLHRAEGGNLYSVIHYRNGTKNPDSEALPDFGTWMEFWPCDEHGNKVRWPTDAQGNML
jgi:hypothetical protein